MGKYSCSTQNKGSRLHNLVGARINEVFINPLLLCFTDLLSFTTKSLFCVCLLPIYI